MDFDARVAYSAVCRENMINRHDSDFITKFVNSDLTL